MRRREFIAGLASVATISPLVASAEQEDRLRRVDVLVAAANENDPYSEARLAALTDAVTTKTLGVELPPALLTTADEVIE